MTSEAPAQGVVIDASAGPSRHEKGGRSRIVNLNEYPTPLAIDHTLAIVIAFVGRAGIPSLCRVNRQFARIVQETLKLAKLAPTKLAQNGVIDRFRWAIRSDNRNCLSFLIESGAVGRAGEPPSIATLATLEIIAQTYDAAECSTHFIEVWGRSPPSVRELIHAGARRTLERLCEIYPVTKRALSNPENINLAAMSSQRSLPMLEFVHTSLVTAGHEESLRKSRDPLIFAANLAWAEGLTFLLSKEYAVSERASRAAASRAGGLPCLETLARHGHPLSSECLEAALRAGSIDNVRFCVSKLGLSPKTTGSVHRVSGRDAKRDRSKDPLLRQACRGGSLECFLYGYVRHWDGNPVPDLEAAASGGAYDIVVFLLNAHDHLRLDANQYETREDLLRLALMEEWVPVHPPLSLSWGLSESAIETLLQWRVVPAGHPILQPQDAHIGFVHPHANMIHDDISVDSRWYDATFRLADVPANERYPLWVPKQARDAEIQRRDGALHRARQLVTELTAELHAENRTTDLTGREASRHGTPASSQKRTSPSYSQNPTRFTKVRKHN